VTEVEVLTIRDTVSGHVLWAAQTPGELNALAVAGTATRINDENSRWAALSYGNDPQIIVPKFDSSSADELTLEMKLNVHLDKEYVANTLTAHLQCTETTVTRLQERLAQLQSEVPDQIQREAQSLQNQLVACENMLNSVLSSASWKMTKPLRNIMSAVRGGTRH
jgi:hypothetical protein